MLSASCMSHNVGEAGLVVNIYNLTVYYIFGLMIVSKIQVPFSSM